MKRSDHFFFCGEKISRLSQIYSQKKISVGRQLRIIHKSLKQEKGDPQVFSEAVHQVYRLKLAFHMKEGKKFPLPVLDKVIAEYILTINKKTDEQVTNKNWSQELYLSKRRKGKRRERNKGKDGWRN